MQLCISEWFWSSEIKNPVNNSILVLSFAKPKFNVRIGAKFYYTNMRPISRNVHLTDNISNKLSDSRPCKCNASGSIQYESKVKNAWIAWVL